jgi:hypothetical protein
VPELLRLQTEDFELTIWCKDIDSRLHAYQTTLFHRRNHTNPAELSLRFTPELHVIECQGGVTLPNLPIRISSLKLSQPLFFENSTYQFEWLFFKSINHAELQHRSERLNQNFRFVPHRSGMPARLTGTLNTGNDVGWLYLPITYAIHQTVNSSRLAFEVLPTKMDLHHDLPVMYQMIDQDFPLWRFSLVEKTEQDVSKGTQTGHFPLMWLAHFTQLRQAFERGLTIISQAPHSRLQTQTLPTKAARLKGNISYSARLKMQEHFAQGQFEKRYAVERKTLSTDTPENRFIKRVTQQCQKQLAQFEIRLRQTQSPDQLKLSEHFFTELQAWQTPLKRMLKQPFLSDIGVLNGTTHESLVLQQKTGYSTVYRIWQDLKHYLTVFDRQTTLSMKSVADIYEVWCFLSIKNILLDELEFELTQHDHPHLELKDCFEYQLKEGFAGAFSFKRRDGVTARLAHEPRFSRHTRHIRSYSVNQAPDILLEITLPPPNNQRFIWLFDAKYRIKLDESIDLVPEDAINQMHRYRDALIRLNQTSDHNNPAGLLKTRPVFGAFALYPGFFNQYQTPNPYYDSIQEVGIGAFALLPDAQHPQAGYVWLLEFLTQQIGTDTHGNTAVSTERIADRIFMQDSVRIPYDGMKQTVYPDLTLTIALGGQNGRSKTYFEAFSNGTAQWYHVPQATFLGRFKQHLVNEIRYLAIASTSETQTSTKQIDKLWPVKSVKLVARHEINEQQSGKRSNSTDPFYLFELGCPLFLQTPIVRVPHPIKGSMKLTRLHLLDHITMFNQIPCVYLEGLSLSRPGKNSMNGWSFQDHHPMGI